MTPIPYMLNHAVADFVEGLAKYNAEGRRLPDVLLLRKKNGRKIQYYSFVDSEKIGVLDNQSRRGRTCPSTRRFQHCTQLALKLRELPHPQYRAKSSTFLLGKAESR